jgi:hypothetical protein
MLIGILIIALMTYGIYKACYDLGAKTLRRYAAHFGGLQVWRVTYTDDNKRSRLVTKADAKYLSETWCGVPWIDYKEGYW